MLVYQFDSSCLMVCMRMRGACQCVRFHDVRLLLLLLFESSVVVPFIVLRYVCRYICFDTSVDLFGGAHVTHNIYLAWAAFMNMKQQYQNSDCDERLTESAEESKDVRVWWRAEEAKSRRMLSTHQRFVRIHWQFKIQHGWNAYFGENFTISSSNASLIRDQFQLDIFNLCFPPINWQTNDGFDELFRSGYSVVSLS